jgi:hypothetical protein
MYRLLLLAALLLIVPASGCSLADAMLNIFGADAYSGGGVTRDDKIQHMQQQLGQ